MGCQAPLAALFRPGRIYPATSSLTLLYRRLDPATAELTLLQCLSTATAGLTLRHRGLHPACCTEDVTLLQQAWLYYTEGLILLKQVGHCNSRNDPVTACLTLLYRGLTLLQHAWPCYGLIDPATACLSLLYRRLDPAIHSVYSRLDPVTQ